MSEIKKIGRRNQNLLSGVYVRRCVVGMNAVVVLEVQFRWYSGDYKYMYYDSLLHLIRVSISVPL
jgi:hypothetical protein